MTRPGLLSGWLLLLMVWMSVAACGRSDPEEALRQRIAAAVAAAEARDTGFFRGLIAESFVDQRGNDRQAILNLIRGQFLINQRVEVISRISEIQIHRDDAARAVISAGIAGSSGQRPALGGINADLYRMELEWVRHDGEWQVIGARWTRAGAP